MWVELGGCREWSCYCWHSSTCLIPVEISGHLDCWTVYRGGRVGVWMGMVWKMRRVLRNDRGRKKQTVINQHTNKLQITNKKKKKQLNKQQICHPAYLSAT